MTEARRTGAADTARSAHGANDRTIDLLEIEAFLDADSVAEILAELDLASGAPATVLDARSDGGVVQPRVRKVTRVEVSPATRARIRQLLLDWLPKLEAHFGARLTGCEEPQFLRYEPGDFFVPHQDGNTPLIHDDSRFRRVSGVIFLSQQFEEPAAGTYGGGTLVFHGPYDGPPVRVVPSSMNPGTMVTFRAETTHEVTMVTHGVWYSIAAFYVER